MAIMFVVGCSKANRRAAEFKFPIPIEVIALRPFEEMK